MNIDQLFNDVPAFANLRDSNRPVWEWLKVQEKNDFRMSLRKSLAQYGSLTERQVSAVERIVNRPAPQADASVGNAFQSLFVAFQTAKSNGLKRPIIRSGETKVYPAGESSTNAGCLYVKDKWGEYLGKVTPQGEFFRARDVSDESIKPVLDLASDPLGTAIRHGLETGECACCGRELTDPESVKQGIGPICKKRFGL